MKRKLGLLLCLLALLAITVVPSGCGSSSATNESSGGGVLAGMMSLLPAETDAIFLFEREGSTAVGDIAEAWDILTGETLPEGAAPAYLAMCSDGAALSAFMYTFEGKAPSWPDELVTETRTYEGRDITQTDDFWDTFAIEGYTIVTIKDDTEAFIDRFHASTGSMADNPAFAWVTEEGPAGTLVIIMEEVLIYGISSSLGLVLTWTEETGELLGVTARFAFEDAEKAGAMTGAVERYLLEDCGLQSATVTQEDDVLRVTGELRSIQFDTLVDILTMNIS